MEALDKKKVFIVFVLEEFIRDEGLPATLVLETFKKHDVFSFLEEGYEVLHTQSLGFVVNEIKMYLAQKNDTLSRSQCSGLRACYS